ncbi:NEDD4-binding protein 2-like 2 [Trichomycterus rosablanca]|uniref:NEDD4-binding protein 2-like 2 n=1 Tax=Trichomycterus rosablanca TaxID=2290929 RepID=UPI002F35A2C9
MPDVNPSGSSPPPVSGNVEDPHRLLKLHSELHQSEEQVIRLPYKVNLTGTRSVPPPHTEHDVETEEVNDRPAGLSTENLSVYETVSNKSRDEVIKEISISSTTFIGPTCRPQPAFEDELSEFYKELEQINNQDTVDGDQGGHDGIPQACIPTVKPSSRKETQGNNHRHAYRPYPPTNTHAAYHRDNGNAQRWRLPTPDMTFNNPNSFSYSKQWQPPPPRPPYGPPSFQFQGPQHEFSPPPPHFFASPPHFESQVNHLRDVESSRWSSWEGTQFPADKRSDCTDSVTQYGRNPSDWQQYEGHHEDQQQRNNDTSLVLILLRGLPGSGKSTLAKELMSTGPNGLILSTDDYFYHRNGYFFQPAQLGDAHDWNQKRTRKAMTEGRSPVIIDNTNVKAWEMKPYVAVALESGYRVEFAEPDTRWKRDPVELERRNKHGVLRDSIAKMLDQFDFPVSVDIVMNSTKPSHKRKQHHSRLHR